MPWLPLIRASLHYLTWHKASYVLHAMVVSNKESSRVTPSEGVGVCRSGCTRTNAVDCSAQAAIFQSINTSRNTHTHTHTHTPQACKLAIRESIEIEVQRERQLRENPDAEIVS